MGSEMCIRDSDEEAKAAEGEEEDDERRTVTDRHEPPTLAAESARKARASLDAARSIVARLNSPPGESRDVVQPGESPLGESPPGHPRGLARSAMKPPPSPATRGAEAAGSATRALVKSAALEAARIVRT